MRAPVMARSAATKQSSLRHVDCLAFARNGEG